MRVQEFFNQLWLKYTQLTPQALFIQKLFIECGAGHNGNTDTGLNRAFDRLRATQLHTDIQIGIVHLVAL